MLLTIRSLIAALVVGMVSASCHGSTTGLTPNGPGLPSAVGNAIMSPASTAHQILAVALPGKPGAIALYSTGESPRLIKTISDRVRDPKAMFFDTSDVLYSDEGFFGNKLVGVNEYFTRTNVYLTTASACCYPLLTVSSLGYIYSGVARYSRTHIFYTPTGRKRPIHPVPATSPSRIVMSPQGYVIVDEANGFKEYDRELHSFGGLFSNFDVVASHGDKIYAIAGTTPNIVIMDSSFHLVGSIDDVWDPKIERFDSMEFDDHNSAYVALAYKATKGGLIEQFAAHSSHVSRKLSLGKTDCAGKLCSYAVDQNGFVYISSPPADAVLVYAPGSHTPRKINFKVGTGVLAVSLPRSP
jgi:hypothetical protein